MKGGGGTFVGAWEHIECHMATYHDWLSYLLQMDSPETRRIVDDIRRETRERIGVVALGIGPVDSNQLRNTLTIPNNWAYAVPDFNSLPQAVFQLTNYIQAAATQAGGSGGNGLVDPLPNGGG